MKSRRMSRRMSRRRRAERLAEMQENPKCNAAPGSIVPVVDLKACEGKGDCAVVCPFDVFEIARIDDKSFAALPIMSRFKLWAHGMKIAYTPNADACQACGLCVVACPEAAIKLERAVVER